MFIIIFFTFVLISSLFGKATNTLKTEGITSFMNGLITSTFGNVNPNEKKIFDLYILFYFILFYFYFIFILFYLFLFYFILFLFYFYYFILFYYYSYYFIYLLKNLQLQTKYA